MVRAIYFQRNYKWRHSSAREAEWGTLLEKNEWEQIEVVYRGSYTMTIWQQDSLSALGRCKGVWDYKLHYVVWGTTQREGCAKSDDIAIYEVACRKPRHGGKYYVGR